MPVSELRSVLTNDNRQFVQSLKQSVDVGKKSGKEIAKAFNPVGAAMSGLKGQFAGLFAVGAVTAGARALGAFASNIKDLSETVNMGAESFQQYSFAVSQSGGSQEVFVKSMIGIQEAQQKAIAGNKEAVQSFNGLGITFDEIQKASPEQLFLLIADEMKRTNGAGATFADLADLIGVKVATKMVPSLKMGSEGFRQLAASATVASQETIDGIEAMQDSWDGWVNSVKTGALTAFDALGDIGGEQTAERLRKATEAFNKTPRAPSPIPGDTGYVPPKPKAPDAVANPGEMFGPEWKQESKEQIAHQKAMQKLADEINAIKEETFYIEQEMRRDAMDSAELVADLEKERAHWVKEALRYESDIHGLKFKEAALARQRAAEIARQIANVPRPSSEQVFTGSPRGRKLTAEEEAKFDMEEKWGRFKKFKTGPFNTSGGGLTTNRLEPATGGLTSGGFGDAYGQVRKGDAARNKAAAEEAKKEKEKNPVVDNTATLVEIFGGQGVRQ